jgi:ATP-binding cassette subfamily B protein
MSEERGASGDPLLPGGAFAWNLRDLLSRPVLTLFRMLQISPLRGLLILAVHMFKTSPVLLLPLFVEYLLEVLSQPGADHFKLLVWPAAGMILLQLLNIPGHVWYTELFSRHVRQFERNLRSILIRRLQYLSIRFHHDRTSGELHAKLLRDVEQVETLIRMIGGKSLEVVLAIGFAVVVTLQREPVMLLFFAVVTPLALFIIRSFRTRLSLSNRHFRQQLERMSSSVGEMIELIPVTKAHGLEGHEIDRMEGHLDHIQQRGRELDRNNAFFESSSFMTLQITQVLCLLATGTLCSLGWISVPELVLYQGLFAIITQSVMHLLHLVPQLSKGLESVHSLVEILKVEELDVEDGKPLLSPVEGNVDFEGVGFSYGDGWAVRDVTLRVTPGECIAFVGESGSGKSTLMNLLIGFYRPQEGRILLEGCPQEEINLQHWRHHLAVVPQSVLLFSGSLRENICYGLQDADSSHLQSVIQAAQLEKVVAGLPEGLDTAIGENGVRLSGGQRQRIAIARALMRDPRILILDEATSALDVISEKEVQLAIDELVKGRTTFIVAHRLSTIRQAHRVVVMREGRPVEIGSQEELMARGGEFARLKALQ